MKAIQIPRALTYIYIIAFAVCIAFTFDLKSRNLLLVSLMVWSPLIILYYKRIYKADLPIILFMAALIIFPLIMNPLSMRWSTVLYSCLFCLSFMAYKRLLLHSYFSRIDYEKVLKLLIYAYVVTLIIQQLGVLTGLPVLNLRNYNPAEPWKLNSLGSEPSWAGRILALLMYSYIYIKEITLGHSYSFVTQLKGADRWLWVGFLWSMLTMGSATAILFLGIVFLKLIRFRNVIPLIILCLALLYIADKNDLSTFERTKNTILATLSFDERRIIEADHSASYRIVPIITVAKMMDIKTFEDWFGHGVDYVKNHVYLGIPGSEGTAGGASLAIAIEYGLISFILLMFFSLQSAINTRDYTTYIFWIMLILIYPLNVQIPWLTMMLLHTNKHFTHSLTVKKKQVVFPAFRRRYGMV